MDIKSLISKWWFWTLVLLILLIVIFYPKPCGGIGGFFPEGEICECLGFDRPYYGHTDCYGICLKNTCEIISPVYGEP